MRQSNWEQVIEAAMGPASRYLGSLPVRSVYRPTDPDEIRSLVGGPTPEEGTSPEEVVAALAQDLEPFIQVANRAHRIRLRITGS